jgi:hypothetical protein
MGAAFGGKIFHAVSKKDTRKIPQQAAGMGGELTTDGSGRTWLEALASPRRLRGYAHSHDDQQDSAGAARVKATTITTQDNASP